MGKPFEPLTFPQTESAFHARSLRMERFPPRSAVWNAALGIPQAAIVDRDGLPTLAHWRNGQAYTVTPSQRVPKPIKAEPARHGSLSSVSAAEVALT